MKFYLLSLVPLLVSFNIKKELNKWEISESKVTAKKISIRDEVNLAYKSCEFEIKAQYFPVNCIRVISKIKKLTNSVQITKFEKRVKKYCVENIESLNSLHKINYIENILETGSDCHTAVMNQKEILIYKLE